MGYGVVQQLIIIINHRHHRQHHIRQEITCTYLRFGELGSKLGLDESRLHETVELKGNNWTRIQSQSPSVLCKVPQNVWRVKETNLQTSNTKYIHNRYIIVIW